MPNTVTIVGPDGGIPIILPGRNKAQTKAELDLIAEVMAKAGVTIKSMRVEFSDGTVFTVEKE